MITLILAIVILFPFTLTFASYFFTNGICFNTPKEENLNFNDLVHI